MAATGVEPVAEGPHHGSVDDAAGPQAGPPTSSSASFGFVGDLAARSCSPTFRNSENWMTYSTGAAPPPLTRSTSTFSCGRKNEESDCWQDTQAGPPGERRPLMRRRPAQSAADLHKVFDLSGGCLRPDSLRDESPFLGRYAGPASKAVASRSPSARGVSSGPRCLSPSREASVQWLRSPRGGRLAVDDHVARARAYAEAVVPPPVWRHASVHDDEGEREAMLAHFSLSRCTEALVRARLQDPMITWDEVRKREGIVSDGDSQFTSEACTAAGTDTPSEYGGAPYGDPANLARHYAEQPHYCVDPPLAAPRPERFTSVTAPPPLGVTARTARSASTSASRGGAAPTVAAAWVPSVPAAAVGSASGWPRTSQPRSHGERFASPTAPVVQAAVEVAASQRSAHVGEAVAVETAAQAMRTASCCSDHSASTGLPAASLVEEIDECDSTAPPSEAPAAPTRSPPIALRQRRGRPESFKSVDAGASGLPLLALGADVASVGERVGAKPPRAPWGSTPVGAPPPLVSRGMGRGPTPGASPSLSAQSSRSSSLAASTRCSSRGPCPGPGPSRSASRTASQGRAAGGGPATPTSSEGVPRAVPEITHDVPRFPFWLAR